MDKLPLWAIEINEMVQKTEQHIKEIKDNDIYTGKQYKEVALELCEILTKVLNYVR